MILAFITIKKNYDLSVHYNKKKIMILAFIIIKKKIMILAFITIKKKLWS